MTQSICMTEPSPTSFRVTLPRFLSGERADKALLKLLGKARLRQGTLPELSRAELNRLFEAGRVRLSGRIVEAGERLPLGSVVEVHFLPEKKWPSLASFAHLRPELILETEHFYAFNKPAGLTMHRFLGMRPSPTFADFILALDPALQGIGEHPERPGIVHRLDKETSGIVLVAKTEEAYVALKSLFQEKGLTKTYLGLVAGQPEASGVIDLPLVRRTGSAKRLILREGKEKPGQLVRQAVTEYFCVKAFEKASLVLMKPKTGRTHQLRAHLQAIKHPLLGDKLYFSRTSREAYPEVARQMLHAFRLQFELFDATYDLEAPVPVDFLETLSDIDSGTIRYKYEDLRKLLDEAI